MKLASDSYKLRHCSKGAQVPPHGKGCLYLCENGSLPSHSVLPHSLMQPGWHKPVIVLALKTYFSKMISQRLFCLDQILPCAHPEKFLFIYLDFSYTPRAECLGGGNPSPCLTNTSICCCSSEYLRRFLKFAWMAPSSHISFQICCSWSIGMFKCAKALSCPILATFLHLLIWGIIIIREGAKIEGQMRVRRRHCRGEGRRGAWPLCSESTRCSV